jgi:branched-chain amino acid transport system ATP-binding protein
VAGSLLDVSDLSVFYGQFRALSGVSLQIDEGEIVALLGSNGAGKSTLLGCITASAPCETRGSIELDGVQLLGKDTEAIIRTGVVLVPEGRQLFGELTVHENLRMGAFLTGDDAELERVYRLFPVLKDRRRQLAQTLSGGEQQMVALGRALMAKPRLMLLDEPSLGLAPKLVGDMFRLIREINAAGVTLLLVEQNARQALRISHRAYVLEKGRVTTSGIAASLASDPAVVASYLGT